MVAFDEIIWKNKSLARHQKRSKCGRSDVGRLKREFDAIDSIEKVVEHCKSLNLRIKFTNEPDGSIYFESSIISINSRLNPIRQLNVILHELGHFNVESKNILCDHLSNSIDSVHNELNAWVEGMSIARSLKINIDATAYERDRTMYVKTYMKSALRRKKP